MIKQVAVPVLAILILGVGLNYSASAQSETTTAQAGPEVVGRATVITVHGKIVKVDRANKLVTLEGPSGNRVTLVVRNPDNLRAAKEGEPFAARFYEIVTIEKKRAGANLPPASLSEGVWTVHPGAPEIPGGSRAMLIKIPVTVDAVDEANGAVTVKSADGSTETVKARNPQNLKRLKVGDGLLISFYRGVAISLRPESGSTGS